MDFLSKIASFVVCILIVFEFWLISCCCFSSFLKLFCIIFLHFWCSATHSPTQSSLNYSYFHSKNLEMNQFKLELIENYSFMLLKQAFLMKKMSATDKCKWSSPAAIKNNDMPGKIIYSIWDCFIVLLQKLIKYSSMHTWHSQYPCILLSKSRKESVRVTG